MRTTARLLGLLLLQACSNNGNNGADAASGDNGSVLKGTVGDSTGQPLAGAVVSIEGTQVTTSDTGEFEMTAAPGMAVVRFGADGFSEAVRRVTIDADAPSYVDVRMRSRGAVHTVNLPGAGETVAVLDGTIQLDLAGGSLCTPDNLPATGSVDVTLTAYPADDQQVMPSDLETTDGRQLVTAGMVAVTASKNDVALKVCGDGSGLTFMSPRFGDLNPSDYRHYILDQQGLWQDVGTGTVDGTSGAWTAGLRNLGVHNIDIPAGTATINGTITDAFGRGIQGVRLDTVVRVANPAYATAYTNNSGYYTMSPSTPPANQEGVSYPMTVTMQPFAYPQDQVPEVTSTDINLMNNQVGTFDINLCLVRLASCGGGGQCCSGLSCDDNVCR